MDARIDSCSICACPLTSGRGEYATLSPRGRSHKSKHHFVAERFFGRSGNRRGTQRERLCEVPLGNRRAERALLLRMPRATATQPRPASGGCLWVCQTHHREARTFRSRKTRSFPSDRCAHSAVSRCDCGGSGRVAGNRRFQQDRIDTDRLMLILAVIKTRQLRGFFGTWPCFIVLSRDRCNGCHVNSRLMTSIPLKKINHQRSWIRPSISPCSSYELGGQ